MLPVKIIVVSDASFGLLEKVLIKLDLEKVGRKVNREFEIWKSRKVNVDGVPLWGLVTDFKGFYNFEVSLVKDADVLVFLEGNRDDVDWKRIKKFGIDEKLVIGIYYDDRPGQGSDVEWIYYKDLKKIDFCSLLREKLLNRHYLNMDPNQFIKIFSELEEFKLENFENIGDFLVWLKNCKQYLIQEQKKFVSVTEKIFNNLDIMTSNFLRQIDKLLNEIKFVKICIKRKDYQVPQLLIKKFEENLIFTCDASSFLNEINSKLEGSVKDFHIFLCNDLPFSYFSYHDLKLKEYYPASGQTLEIDIESSKIPEFADSIIIKSNETYYLFPKDLKNHSELFFFEHYFQERLKKVHIMNLNSKTSIQICHPYIFILSKTKSNKGQLSTFNLETKQKSEFNQIQENFKFFTHFFVIPYEQDFLISGNKTTNSLYIVHKLSIENQSLELFFNASSQGIVQEKLKLICAVSPTYIYLFFKTFFIESINNHKFFKKLNLKIIGKVQTNPKILGNFIFFYSKSIQSINIYRYSLTTEQLNLIESFNL